MAGVAVNGRSLSVYAVTLIGWLLLEAAQALELTAGDGLSLTLDDATGAVTRVAVNGRALPLLPGQPGGLAIREWQPRAPTAQGPIASVECETAQDWRVYGSGNPEPGGQVIVEQRTDGGALGTKGYVRAGTNRKYGYGVSFPQGIPVTPGGTYAISWQGRVPAVAATYIVYVRAFDATGRDVTGTTPAPEGWDYSPYSSTHYQLLIAAQRAAVWEGFRRRYRVPEGVTALRVAVCLWRGEYVDIDHLWVEDVGGAVPGDSAVLTGPVVPAADSRSAVQHIVSAEHRLEVRLAYSAGPTGIRVAAELRDSSEPLRERALEVSYRLPLQVQGWAWHDDIRRQRPIEPGLTYSNDFGIAGHQVSRYPFSCIASDAAGLVLGMPLDCPAMERRYCRADTGLVQTLELGLSPVTSHLGPGCARWTFTIGAVDQHWGFRAAAAKYYAWFPQSFEKRAQREGAWLWPVSPDQVPDPEDFGLAFWEASANRETPAACAASRQKGIYVLHYIEPSGLRQWFPEVKGSTPMYSLSECLARLRQLAGDSASTRKWGDGPEAEIAQAVLNSLPEQADGTVPFEASDRYDAWAQWWYTNPSPYLAAPNRGGTCWTYEVAPRLPTADGVYVDSVGIAQSLAFENHRPAHLAVARTPLSFDLDEGKPCLPAVSSCHDYLAWLAGELQSRHKLLMLNIGVDPPAYRFFAHTGDVLGCEISTRNAPGGRRPWEVEPDASGCLRRTYAYRKPTTNLLQDGNWTIPVPAATHAEIEQYIKHQMFYGFYPAVCTIGGEDKPGYANWKRYFGSPEQYERDRDLFRKYVPVIRRLNAAGWEPVTLARAFPADTLFIERFGQGASGTLFFTLLNSVAERLEGTVRVDPQALGGLEVGAQPLLATDLFAEQSSVARVSAQDGTVEFAVTVDGHDTLVVKLAVRSEK